MEVETYLYAILAVMVLIVGLIVVQDRRQTAEETETPINPAQMEEKTNPISNSERMRARWQAGVKDDRQSQIAQAMLEKLIAEAKAKKSADEAAYWESLREWIENFPFQKTYHPPSILAQKHSITTVCQKTKSLVFLAVTKGIGK